MKFYYRPLLCVFTLAAAFSARAQTNPSQETTVPPSVQLEPFQINEQLDRARQDIVPELGATAYLVGTPQIDAQSQGANAPFNQLLLRTPGVAQDSAANGDLHVRGEHANLQYRINDVLLPEGISGFGLELDTRFVDTTQLITGSLPAQYGFRTAGIVDIHTKNGGSSPGGDVSIYGGSFDTFKPSAAFAGMSGNLSYFANASYDWNSLGIENPTNNKNAIHDHTEQRKVFSDLSYVIDSSSRLSVMLGLSRSDFEVPDTFGSPAGTSPSGDQWTPGSFDSAKLDENQKEDNDFAIAAYQKSAGNVNFQISVFARESKVHFIPDVNGDLFFNGVASDVTRTLDSGGVEFDGSDRLGDQHTIRAGFSILDESVSSRSLTTVLPVDENGNAVGSSYSIGDQGSLHGLFAGLYLQDEWKFAPHLTLNYGARFDAFHSSFDHETQLSPRINIVYQLTRSTTFHTGYARYFTPPPVENVSAAAVSRFDNTSNAAALDLDDPVKAERANYLDIGASQKVGTGFQVGLDGYYKKARNQLDDGLFGQTLILSAFNYAKGEVYGLELTASYAKGGFSAYTNLAKSVAKGKDWNSSQFLFDPGDLAYVKDHWIYLDHDQSLTGSFGISYRWDQNKKSHTLFYADSLYGTGLRNDAVASDGTTIPNGGTVPSYVTVNLGAEQTFELEKRLAIKLRLDVVNVADKSYELRDGSGVGVNAAQYGMRRGFFGSAALEF